MKKVYEKYMLNIVVTTEQFRLIAQQKMTGLFCPDIKDWTENIKDKRYDYVSLETDSDKNSNSMVVKYKGYKEVNTDNERFYKLKFGDIIILIV